MALIAFRDALRTPVGLAEQGGLVSKLLGQNSLNETVVEQGPEMVAIPAGGFFMGSPEGEGGWLHGGVVVVPRNNPPAKPGALEFVSRSKRLNGVANATPRFLGHLKVADQRHRFNASSC
jgi:hypothetical protein